MPTFLTQVLQQIAAIWRRLTMPARVAVAMTVLIAIGVLSGILFWSARPSYVTLASDLTADEITSVYQALEGEDITPRIRDNGRAIAVPANRLSDAQRVLAGAGVSADSFDAGDDGGGMFKSKEEKRERELRRREQHIARRLEGNRLILSAQVSIAGGRQSLYQEREAATTAAVQLTLRPGTALTSAQVQSVVRSVANSVTGLDANNVTVTDDRFNTLASGSGEATGQTEGTFLEGERQWRERKIFELLESTVGPDGVRVVVTVAAEFIALTTEKTTYDPENRVVRSEKTIKTSGSQPMLGGTPGAADPTQRTNKSEDKTKEYMVPVTTTTETLNRPRIKRVTAGIFVDRARIPGDDDAAKNATIAAWVETLANAIGTGELKGDEFALDATLLKITPSDFLEPPEFPEPVAASMFTSDRIVDLATYGAAGLAGLGLLLFFRSSMRAVGGNRLPAPQIGGGLDLTVGGDPTEELTVNPRVEERNRLKREISRAIEQDPRAVAKLVEMWLTEEGD